jgi:hypothetical protein
MSYVEAYERKLAREIETRERQKLAVLQAKYQGVPEVSPTASLEAPDTEPVFVASPLPPLAALYTGQDVQFSLFR